MKEKPILFSGEMVRAILDGRKTQTRRVIKRWPPKIRLNRRVSGDWPFSNVSVEPGVYQPYSNPYGALSVVTDNGKKLGIKPSEFEWISPYGQSGDHLWVRETWSPGYVFDGWPPREIPDDAPIHYWADGNPPAVWDVTKPKPSIFMPRWASRITLEVVSVRVERLQEITDMDAIAEGVHQVGGIDRTGLTTGETVLEFRTLWDSINAARGYGWDSNPWVWVVEFKKVEPTQ